MAQSAAVAADDAPRSCCGAVAYSANSALLPCKCGKCACDCRASLRAVAGYECARSHSARASRQSLSSAAAPPDRRAAGPGNDRPSAAKIRSRKHAAPRPDTPPAACLPAAGVGGSSKLFFKHILQHLFVQRQVRHDPFQLRVLFFQLPQATQLNRIQTAVLLLPAVERGFTDPQLAADFRD